MHPIDTASPLCDCSPEGLEAIEAEILVTVAGLDETSGHTVHARHSYLPAAIRFGYRYVDVFSTGADGRRELDYRLFHDAEPVPGGETP